MNSSSPTSVSINGTTETSQYTQKEKHLQEYPLLDLVENETQRKKSKHMSQSRLNVQVSSCFLWVKCAVKQLQKDFLYFLYQDTRDCNGAKKIEDEVHLEGHFPVFTPGSGEAKKFLVAFSFLQYPPFVKLLDDAEREFGFDQPGVLAVPCEANELQRILSRKRIDDQEIM